MIITRFLQNFASEAVSKVLLVTYWRGGSTFLGKLFERNPDSFYWYEPLIAEMRKWEKEENIIDDVYLSSGDSYRYQHGHINQSKTK